MIDGLDELWEKYEKEIKELHKQLAIIIYHDNIVVIQKEYEEVCITEVEGDYRTNKKASKNRSRRVEKGS